MSWIGCGPLSVAARPGRAGAPAQSPARVAPRRRRRRLDKY